jgi:hypothetical protein
MTKAMTAATNKLSIAKVTAATTAAKSITKRRATCADEGGVDKDWRDIICGAQRAGIR